MTIETVSASTPSLTAWTSKTITIGSFQVSAVAAVVSVIAIAVLIALAIYFCRRRQPSPMPLPIQLPPAPPPSQQEREADSALLHLSAGISVAPSTFTIAPPSEIAPPQQTQSSIQPPLLFSPHSTTPPTTAIPATAAAASPAAFTSMQTAAAAGSPQKWSRERVRNEYIQILEAIGTKWCVELNPTGHQILHLENNADLYDLVTVCPELYQHRPETKKHFDSFFQSTSWNPLVIADNAIKKPFFLSNFRIRVKTLLEDQSTCKRVLGDLKLQESRIRKLLTQDNIQDLVLYFFTAPGAAPTTTLTAAQPARVE